MKRRPPTLEDRSHDTALGPRRRDGAATEEVGGDSGGSGEPTIEVLINDTTPGNTISGSVSRTCDRTCEE